LALLPMGFTEPDRSPGLLVSSYLTVSPLPTGCPAGGLLSVALSLTLRPVGVTHHRALRSPDFPPADGCPSAGDHPVRFSRSSECYTRGREGRFANRRFIDCFAGLTYPLVPGDSVSDRQRGPRFPEY